MDKESCLFQGSAMTDHINDCSEHVFKNISLHFLLTIFEQVFKRKHSDSER